MTLAVNGRVKEYDDAPTVAALLYSLGIDDAGIAVAVNERVVRRAAFGEHGLRDGDTVEIIRAVAGG